MAEKKSLLLRINPDLWDDLQRMAAAEFRSINGQIEFLLNEAVRKNKTSRRQDEITKDPGNFT